MRDLAAAVVAGDPELRAELTAMFRMAIDDAKRVYRWGDARDRALYTRQLVPALLRGMQDADAGAADSAMVDAWERMRVAMGGDSE